MTLSCDCLTLRQKGTDDVMESWLMAEGLEMTNESIRMTM